MSHTQTEHSVTWLFFNAGIHYFLGVGGEKPHVEAVRAETSEILVMHAMEQRQMLK